MLGRLDAAWKGIEMANFNKVMLLGNLTRDPQLSYTPNQTAVVEFGLATNRKFKRQDGSPGEEVCFVDCQAFARTAETINKYCKKGDPLLVEGRLKFDSWEDKDGKKRSELRVNVENFQFISSGGNRSQGQSFGAEQESSQVPVSNGEAAGLAGDDDIPF